MGKKRYEYATCGCVLFESAEKNHRLQKYPRISADEVVLLTQTFMVCLILKLAFNGTWAKSPYKTLLQSSRVIFPDSRPTLATESVLLIANNKWKKW